MVFLIIPLVLILSGILLVVVMEAVHPSVYGKSIPEEQLDEFFGKHLDKISVNQYSQEHNIFFIGDRESDIHEAVVLSPSPFLSKWSIQSRGTIPRRSKWTKILDTKRVELIAIEEASDDKWYKR